MWCDDGSLDYQHQEEFDAWSKAKVRWMPQMNANNTDFRPTGFVCVQGMSREEAIAAFCHIYAEAHTPERAKLNFYQRA